MQTSVEIMQKIQENVRKKCFLTLGICWHKKGKEKLTKNEVDGCEDL